MGLTGLGVMDDRRMVGGEGMETPTFAMMSERGDSFMGDFYLTSPGLEPMSAKWTTSSFDGDNVAGFLQSTPVGMKGHGEGYGMMSPNFRLDSGMNMPQEEVEVPVEVEKDDFGVVSMGMGQRQQADLFGMSETTKGDTSPSKLGSLSAVNIEDYFAMGKEELLNATVGAVTDGDKGNAMRAVNMFAERAAQTKSNIVAKLENNVSNEAPTMNDFFSTLNQGIKIENSKPKQMHAPSPVPKQERKLQTTRPVPQQKDNARAILESQRTMQQRGVVIQQSADNESPVTQSADITNDLNEFIHEGTAPPQIENYVTPFSFGLQFNLTPAKPIQRTAYERMRALYVPGTRLSRRGFNRKRPLP